MKKKQQKLQTPQKPTKHSTQNETSEQTFLEHLYELRSRLFWVIATIIVASAAGFQFKDQLTSVTMAPLHGQKLVYLTPGGGFGFIFTLAIYFGVLVAIPVIVYHVYRFLQPLLKQTSRKLVASFMLLSCILALAGAAFGYFVTIPAALDFLATFAGDAIIPNLTAESYLSFVVAYVLGLALLFQLPLLLFLFDHVKQFPPGALLSSQRPVIIGATVVAAIITPTPDAFNMAIVAVPIIAIYQLGVIAIVIRHYMLRRAEQKQVLHLKEHTEPAVHEPLTKAVETMDTPVPVVVADQPILHETKENSSAFQQANVAERPSISVRTIDGVMRMRQAQPVIVPVRKGKDTQLAPRVRYDKPVRSLDGLSVLRYSSNS